jgi:hypothetical protein
MRDRAEPERWSAPEPEPEVPVVHTSPGMAVVAKPAGLSTEALVAGLAPSTLAAMGCVSRGRGCH